MQIPWREDGCRGEKAEDKEPKPERQVLKQILNGSHRKETAFSQMEGTISVLSKFLLSFSTFLKLQYQDIVQMARKGKNYIHLLFLFSSGIVSREH